MSGTTSRILVPDGSKALLECKWLLDGILGIPGLTDDDMDGCIPFISPSIPLQNDLFLKELAVTKEVFEEKVKRQGERAFYQLWREVARTIFHNQKVSDTGKYWCRGKSCFSLFIVGLEEQSFSDQGEDRLVEEQKTAQ